jgi:hypothetical protein
MWNGSISTMLQFEFFDLVLVASNRRFGVSGHVIPR